jgi:hypothetical protein
VYSGALVHCPSDPMPPRAAAHLLLLLLALWVRGAGSTSLPILLRRALRPRAPFAPFAPRTLPVSRGVQGRLSREWRRPECTCLSTITWDSHKGGWVGQGGHMSGDEREPPCHNSGCCWPIKRELYSDPLITPRTKQDTKQGIECAFPDWAVRQSGVPFNLLPVCGGETSLGLMVGIAPTPHPPQPSTPTTRPLTPASTMRRFPTMGVTSAVSIVVVVSRLSSVMSRSSTAVPGAAPSSQPSHTVHTLELSSPS